MDFPFPLKKWDKQDWDQIKGLTKAEIISLLQKDNRWQFVGAKGSKHVFQNTQYKPPFDYVSIHYHPKERFREEKLLKHLLNHICWTREDFVKWKIIKR